MLPAYYDGKFLPEGDHPATWEEVCQRFGWNDKRRGFCDRLFAFLRRAKRCGFLRVYLFGSFVSAEDDPGDVDLLWVYTENLNFDLLAEECRELLNYTTMRAREGWDMFCCSDNAFVINYLVDGWRRDKSPERKPRGVIILDLRQL